MSLRRNRLVTLRFMSMEPRLVSQSPLTTCSPNTFQTLEKILSALPQSQIVFNSPIKEVSGEYSGLSSLHQSGPNTSTPADDLDGTASGQGITPHSSPSL